MGTYTAFHNYSLLLLTESGKVFTFGNNGEGQLGVDDESVSSSVDPVEVKGLEPMKIKMLAAGADHSVILTRK